ncbi:MAG: hypothetical protein AAF628_34800 [Planctomycetota bacterium]
MRTSRIIAVTGIVLCAAWLLYSRSDPPLEGRNFFGHWRTAPLLVAAALLWLSLAATLAARRQALFSFVLATTGLGAGVALLETAAIVGVADYASVLGNRVHAGHGSIATPHLDLQGETFQDTASAWNLPAEPRPFHYRTDARGFRNPTDRDAADVYLLGDSVLVAGLIEESQTVRALLEARLARPVMTVALIGIGAQRELEILRESDLPLDGAVVLQFATEANDLADAVGDRSTPGAEPQRSYRERSFVANAVLWAQRLLQPVPYDAHWNRGTIGDQSYLFFWTGRRIAPFADETATVQGLWRQTAAFVREAGGSYGLVLVPSKYRTLQAHCTWPAETPLADPQAHLSPLRPSLLEWAAAEGDLPVLDLTEPFQAAVATAAVPYFWGDTHPNETGHRIMARELARWSLLSGIAKAR